MTTNFFSLLSLVAVFWIGDPGSEIRDPGWVKIRIPDKHPGSATLHLPLGCLYGHFKFFSSGYEIPYPVYHSRTTALKSEFKKTIKTLKTRGS
jgi:hypothetical protein